MTDPIKTAYTFQADVMPDAGLETVVVQYTKGEGASSSLFIEVLGADGLLIKPHSVELDSGLYPNLYYEIKGARDTYDDTPGVFRIEELSDGGVQVTYTDSVYEDREIHMPQQHKGVEVPETFTARIPASATPVIVPTHQI